MPARRRRPGRGRYHEHAVEEAAGDSAEVVVAHHEPDWLREHGDIAALLRR
jgi:hypothetical protein